MKRAISLSFVAFLIATSLQIRAQEISQNNIKPVQNSLEIVSKLQPVSFNYDEAWAEKLGLKTTAQYGFVGKEAQKTNPALVAVQAKDYSAGKNAYKTATLTKVDYESLIPLLVGSIKEQQAQIEALKQEVQQLKAAKAD